MPNTGRKRPAQPLPVMVRDEHRPSLWGYGAMEEWRWVDEAAGAWEGLVSLDSRVFTWVPGSRLTRIGAPRTQPQN
ncbi:MAG: hypothetical protein PSX37_10820 [bacterium]|nr:hypothetical protein [bacterium]